MNYEIEKITTDIVIRAAALEVRDQASANRATELVLAGKDAIKKIKAFFAPMKESAWTAHQEVVQKEKAELGKIEPAVSMLGERISRWHGEEARKCLAAEAERARIENERRRIEEETLQRAREAEEKSERERKRLEEQAEQLKQEAEKSRNAAERKRIEDEQKKLRLQTEEVQRIADEETALAIDEGAAAESALPPAPALQEAPRTTGLTMRRYWKARINDPFMDPIKANLRLLLRAILDEQVSIEAVSPCMTYLNDLAGRLKDQIKIPGVEFYFEERMAEIGKRNKA